MKVELGLSAGRRAAPVRARFWADLTAPVRHLPQRLRDRRFWHVQAMVLVATAPHYFIEQAGFTNPFETFHGLAMTLYVVPLLYAAITFGWEGAILTALWAAVLTSPSIWVWHRASYHWLAEVGQLAITLPMGVLVAWRVELEAKQRRRAEQTSASLSLLNEIGERLGHTLEVELALPGVLARLYEGLSIDAAWLCLEPESSGGDSVVMVQARTPSLSAEIPIEEVHRLTVATGESVSVEGRAVGIPMVTEGGVMGSIGAAASPGQALSEEQLTLLGTVAHEIRVAVENARLYRQRQESLQSYARQVTQAQEEERLRIARELHDETAQELVHLVRRLEQMGELAPAPLAPHIQELLELARSTLQSVRRFSRDLRPSVLDDLGLLPAIELAVEETNGRLAGGARLAVTGEPRRLDPQVELALFRIAQEALHNVERHACATTATVEVNFLANAVRLVVTDDGRGYQTPPNFSDLARAGKLGILGMKERAELVGGTLELHSLEGQGSSVVVEVVGAGP